MRRDRLRVVVAGMVAGVPGQGGASWAVLQWVLGLRALGHDVLLVEPVDVMTDEASAYLDDVVATFGLRSGAALVAGSDCRGLLYPAVEAFCRSADVVLDLAGMLADHDELLGHAPVRVYVDLDPCFTQLWHTQGTDMGFDGHTHFATVGLGLGSEDCEVPTCDVAWLPTLPPVSLDHWGVAAGPGAVWTTVAHWRGYGTVWADDRRYGQKAHSWRPLMDLPRRTGALLCPALAIHPDEVDDIAALREHGWRWIDPALVTASPMAYQAFVAGSAGEIGIAKEGYVLSRSGWFSDRSACYLAAGRPVIAQDTGFSAHLPTGEGLLAFSDVEEAAEALDAACADHARHAAAARGLAEDHLDARVVVERLLDRIGTAP